MYYYGGGSFNSFPSCGCNMNSPWWGSSTWGCNSGNNNNYAIILVLFILLVIVLGARYTR